MEDKKVLIVGGGLEGVNAALAKAEEGASVTVIDKFPNLGAERIPRDRIIKPEEAFVSPELAKLKENGKIRVLTQSYLKKVKKDGEKVVTSIKKPSVLVDNSKCTDCKACIKV